MMLASFFLLLAITTVDLDVVSVPFSSDVRVPLTPAGRSDLKREGTVTRIRIEIDRIGVSTAFGRALSTYVVWAISPEGVYDNLGEMEINGAKGEFSATTRLGQFGILITAEPHYMVDRPGAAVAYRSSTPPNEVRRRTIPVGVGAYDYTNLKFMVPAVGVPGWVVQARAAFEIAQSTGADRLASTEFRNAQVALGSMEELLNRGVPLDILWPTTNEAIRWSQRAAAVAREKR